MLLVGLTGGIATGKSVVSGILKSLGAYIIDADLIARHLERLLKKTEEQASYEFLRERGLIY